MLVKHSLVSTLHCIDKRLCYEPNFSNLHDFTLNLEKQFVEIFGLTASWLPSCHSINQWEGDTQKEVQSPINISLMFAVAASARSLLPTNQST